MHFYIFKPYKMELNKVMKLKTILLYLIKQKVYFARFHFYNTHIFKSHQRSEPSKEKKLELELKLEKKLITEN